LFNIILITFLAPSGAYNLRPSSGVNYREASTDSSAQNVDTTGASNTGRKFLPHKNINKYKI